MLFIFTEGATTGAPSPTPVSSTVLTEAQSSVICSELNVTSELYWVEQALTNNKLKTPITNIILFI